VRLVYFAFVIDVFSQRIGNWRSQSPWDAEQPAPTPACRPISCSTGSNRRCVIASWTADSWSTPTLGRNTSRCGTPSGSRRGAGPSLGSVGDASDNALAESVIGLSKTEVIYRRGRWRGFDDMEYATLEWVAWFNQQRFLEPLGYAARTGRTRKRPTARSWPLRISQFLE